MRAYGSDLNPVAVLISKALVEIPPKFAGRLPVHPGHDTHKHYRGGAQGLAEDVRFYGRWMRDEAEKRIGHLYPKARLPDGTKATVIGLAVGAHGALARPARQGRDGAAGVVVPGLDQGGEEGLGRAGDRPDGALTAGASEVRTGVLAKVDEKKLSNRRGRNLHAVTFGLASLTGANISATYIKYRSTRWAHVGGP